MKKVIKNDKYGEITYDENFWIGRKSLSINGTPLKKIDKKTFETADSQRVVVKGNYLCGVKLQFGEENIEVMPTIKWYEVVLALLPLIFDLVWGNSVTLCTLVPVVGGAIGGLIGGLMAGVSLLLMRMSETWWVKLVIGLAALAVTFGICAAIGYAIVSA